MKLKKWELYLVLGIAELLIAFILIIWAFQSLDKSIQLARHGEIDVFFIWPLIFGFLLLGSGSTDLGVVPVFYKMEKEK